MKAAMRSKARLISYGIQLIKRIREHLLQPGFFKFVVIGGVNTLSSTSFALCFSIFLQTNAAFVLGYLISLALAYFLNAKFVFKSKLSAKKYLMFCVSYIPNFVINNMVLLVLYNLLEFHRFIAIALAACIGLPVTYLCVKAFVFGKHDKGV